MQRVILIMISAILAFSPAKAQNPDIDLLKSINVDRNKNLDPFFRGVTFSVYPVTIVTPAMILSMGIKNHDSSLKIKALYIGECIAVSSFITTVTKLAVNRPRPYVTYKYLDQETFDDHLPSFPSAHTSFAFATATSLSMVFPKWYVISPMFLWAGTVGYSRMHLGVHYPTDVLVGAIVGSGSAFLCMYLNKKLFKTGKPSRY